MRVKESLKADAVEKGGGHKRVVQTRSKWVKEGRNRRERIWPTSGGHRNVGSGVPGVDHRRGFAVRVVRVYSLFFLAPPWYEESYGILLEEYVLYLNVKYNISKERKCRSQHLVCG